MDLRAAALVGALLLSLCATCIPTNTALAGGDETLHFRLFQAPKYPTEGEMGPLHYTRVVLEGTSANDWTESIEILDTAKKGEYKKARDVASALRASRRKSCAAVTDTVLAEDDASVYWTATSDSCQTAPSQITMTRVLCGKKKTFILLYTSTREITPERRQKLETMFRGASIVKL